MNVSEKLVTVPLPPSSQHLNINYIQTYTDTYIHTYCIHTYIHINLYNLTKNYFSQQSAVLSTNSVRMQREGSKGCPQGLWCGLGFWNIQYNSLLNL